MMRVNCICSEPSLWNTQRIVNTLLPVVQDAYEDAERLIMKDLRMSDRIYLLGDENNVLQGFLMAGFDQPCDVRLAGRTPVYVGLSAVMPGARGDGELFTAFQGLY